MAETKSNVLISYKNKYYKFISCALNNSDGSFYLTFVRDGASLDCIYLKYFKDGNLEHQKHNESLKKSVRVSYHASGQVNYHFLEKSTNFYEPITRLTILNYFVSWSIPSIEKLDVVNSVKDNDYVLRIEESDSERIHFDFMLAPWQHKEEDNYFAVRYHDLFALIIIPSYEPKSFPKEIEKHFTSIAPTAGLFERQVMQTDQALIEFHQILNKTDGIILYQPNGEGICTLIASNVMARVPVPKIEFVDSTLSIEVVNSKRNVIKFKIKDKNGNTVKKEVPILSITLDSRL